MRRTGTLEEHRHILLVLMHGIKLCMDEYLQQGDKYFIILTQNKIYDETADIMCMYCSEFTYIINKFMEEGNLFDPCKDYLTTWSQQRTQPHEGNILCVKNNKTSIHIIIKIPQYI